MLSKYAQDVVSKGEELGYVFDLQMTEEKSLITFINNKPKGKSPVTFQSWADASKEFMLEKQRNAFKRSCFDEQDEPSR